MKKTDLINKEIIKTLNPCENRFNNYLKYYSNFNGTLKSFLSLDNITYSDKVWVVTRLFTKKQSVAWSIKCALSVLTNFESAYPSDLRPRQALEAAEAYLNNPCEETKLAALSESNSARSAARSAAQSAALSAESAAWSAAMSAMSAARSAARSAALSAVSSALKEEEQEELNLIFMIEVLEGV